MSTTDTVNLVGIAVLLLSTAASLVGLPSMIRNNRLLAENNRLMAGDSATIMATKPSWLRMYWPAVLTGLMMLLAWGALGYNYQHFSTITVNAPETAPGCDLATMLTSKPPPLFPWKPYSFGVLSGGLVVALTVSVLNRRARKRAVPEMEHLEPIAPAEPIRPPESIANANRRITPHQMDEIRSRLKKFGHLDVGILLCKSSGEALNFARDVGAALMNAGWIAACVARTDRTVLARGLVVEMNQDVDRFVRLAAGELIEAFRACGIDVHPDVVAPMGGTFANDVEKDAALAAPIRINVGEHPRGY